MKKRLFRLSLVLATVLVLFAGCGKEEFDEDLLIGSWSASDGYNYVFLEDHTGSSTDSSGKGLNYDWSLDADELQLKFKGSGQAGKVGFLTFIIESLTETKMEAYDKNDPDETIIFKKK